MELEQNCEEDGERQLASPEGLRAQFRLACDATPTFANLTMIGKAFLRVRYVHMCCTATEHGLLAQDIGRQTAPSSHLGEMSICQPYD